MKIRSSQYREVLKRKNTVTGKPSTILDFSALTATKKGKYERIQLYYIHFGEKLKKESEELLLQ